jgi:thiamine-phosphate pyrophosphorylase
MKPIADCRLYAFVDTGYLRGRPPEQIAQALCDGGADLIQLRAKGLPVEVVRSLAESVLPITQRAGVGLVINDHYAVARSVGAPLCHLGQEDFFEHGYTHASQLAEGTAPDSLATRAGISDPARCAPAESASRPPAIDAPPVCHPPPLLGLSTHAPQQARRAIAAGAAYLAMGPVYATGTKPGARPVTIEYVRWAAGNVRLPWFAIGGINIETLDAVLAAGARRVCVVSAILDAPDIVRACQAFKDRLLSAA